MCFQISLGGFPPFFDVSRKCPIGGVSECLSCRYPLKPEDAQRLRQNLEGLETLRKEGVLSDPEYAARRRMIVGLMERKTGPPGEGSRIREYGHIDNRPLGLLEPTAVELKDGRVVMLMRAEWGGFLWRAESSDRGRTWTDAWETNIPNPTVKPYLLRLDDGRIALIHNATGKKGEFGDRDPLSIWISADEMETWSIKEDVISGGSLAYPNAIMLNGKLVFAYDRNRREARFVEVELK